MLKYLSLGTSQVHFMQSWGTKIKAHLGQYSGQYCQPNDLYHYIITPVANHRENDDGTS